MNLVLLTNYIGYACKQVETKLAHPSFEKLNELAGPRWTNQVSWKVLSSTSTRDMALAVLIRLGESPPYTTVSWG